MSAGLSPREALQDQLRSALELGRLLLVEVFSDDFAREDPAAYRDLAGKAGGELAMLLRLAARALPGDDDQREILAIAAQLQPLARMPQLYRCLVMRPSRASLHVLAHLCLSELGLRDEGLDRAARRALRAAAANERGPCRQLDAAWTRHIAFGDHELEHPALALSPIGTGVDLLATRTDDAYAFTHALQYATDFGRVALPAWVDREATLGVVEALALQALDEDDLELLAELLMAPALLRMPWTPMLAFAWQVVDACWQAFGFVPGPGLPPERADETHAHAVRRILGTVYHTTFGAGVCCATLLACDALPPQLPCSAVLARSLPPGRGRAWRAHWRRLTPAARQSLALLEQGFKLRRALESSELPAVQRVVQAAAQQGLLAHPLFLQALELLGQARDLPPPADTLQRGGLANTKAMAAATPSAAITSITSR